MPQVSCGGRVANRTCSAIKPAGDAANGSNPTENALHCEHVKLRTLDSVLEEQNPQTVDVAKIDVESFECQVFAGGQTLFTRYRPRFLLAETKDPSVERCVHKEAARHGYEWGGRKGKTKTSCSFAHDLRCVVRWSESPQARPERIYRKLQYR